MLIDQYNPNNKSLRIYFEYPNNLHGWKIYSQAGCHVFDDTN